MLASVATRRTRSLSPGSIATGAPRLPEPSRNGATRHSQCVRSAPRARFIAGEYQDSRHGATRPAMRAKMPVQPSFEARAGKKGTHRREPTPTVRTQSCCLPWAAGVLSPRLAHSLHKFPGRFRFAHSLHSLFPLHRFCTHFSSHRYPRMREHRCKQRAGRVSVGV